MPEPPDEFEREVREELDDMAGEAAPSPTAPPGVLRSARRRVARNSAVLVVALAMVMGGVVAGIQLVGRDGSGPIPIATTEPPTSGVPTCDLSHQQGGTCPGGSTAPETTSPTTPATSTPSATSSPSEPGPPGGTGTGPLPTMLFVDGVIYRYLNGTKGLAAVRVGSVPETTAEQPPVATPFGIVVLGGRPGQDTELWSISESGGRHLIATNVDGFGVSADGSRLAYAQRSDGFRSVLHLIEAGRPEQSGVRLGTFARVIGFAGDRVVLETGDGAGATVATWRPGDDHIVPVDGYGSAVATDPPTGWAVLDQGDGPCWAVLRIRTDGSVGEPKLGDCRGFVGVSFEPGGGTLAGVEFGPAGGSRQLVLAGTIEQLGGGLSYEGAFQTWWDGLGEFLVMSEPTTGHLAITQCRVSENICPDPPLWSGEGSGGVGTAWIVEKRPWTR
jgi:hypothetical protein